MTDAALQSIRHIELLVRRDPGSRGFAALVPSRDLVAAAVDLLGGQRVVLVTGFCIRGALIGETDGPSGTLALADALRALGKDVTLVTDAYSSALLAAGAAVCGAPFPTVLLELPQAHADREIDALLATVRPSHVVAIERPGGAVDGRLYSMRGEPFDDLVARADRLFAPVFTRDYCTIAIGDGGNELGFGGQRAALHGAVAHGELIFCATPADYLIPAGISNWGAFALVAALSLISGKPLLAPPEREREVLAAIVGAGAVDGCTRENAISVDGLEWDAYASTLAEIYAETRRTLAAA